VVEHKDSRLSRRVRSDPSVSTLAQALANPWRARILRELTLRPLSVKQFTEEVGGSASTISRHFTQLQEWGFIELIEMKSGGARYGGVERVYRAVQRDHLDAEAWSMLTQAEREAKSDNMIASYFQRVLEAVEAETFDADVTRHWSWDAVDLDQQGWSELTERLDEILTWVRTLVAESEARARQSGEELVHGTVGLALFRSPGESDRDSPTAGEDGSDLPPLSD
jgi:DNA-binding transcriptional ArsR family regulator